MPDKNRALSKKALAAQFHTERKKYLGYIRRYIYDSEELQDIFQKAILKFLTAKVVFGHPRIAKTYFYKILSSLSIDHIRKSSRLTFPEILPETACYPQEEWDRKLLMDRVSEATETLSEKDREILKLCLDPGLMRLKDKCSVMRRSTGTVRYHMRKLVQNLRRNLEEAS